MFVANVLAAMVLLTLVLSLAPGPRVPARVRP
jgi:hypothetical protein